MGLTCGDVSKNLNNELTVKVEKISIANEVRIQLQFRWNQEFLAIVKNCPEYVGVQSTSVGYSLTPERRIVP